jgi:hypothetical protein
MGAPEKLNFFFLVGCPRSGTTLLQRLLDAHPDVAVAPETFFIERFWQKREEYGPLDDDRCFERLLHDISAVPEFAEMGLNKDAFFERATGARTYPVLFRLWLAMYAEQRGVRHVGEKTPSHALHMPTLAEFFPESRFINIIRDPRAVVNSLRHVPWSKGCTKGDAEIWRRYAKTARHALASKDARLTNVRYEELVTDPEQKLKEVCEFLGLSYDREMMNFPSKSTSVNPEREPWKKNVMKPVSVDSLTSWKQELVAERVTQAEAVAFWEMREWGYTNFETPVVRLLPHAIQHLALKAFKRLPTLKERIKRMTPGKAHAS